MRNFLTFIKYFIILFILIGVLVLGLKVYYEWKQYKDQSVFEIIGTIIDKKEDDYIKDAIGGDDNIFVMLQNTEDDDQLDSTQSYRFLTTYNLTLNSDRQYLYNAYRDGKLKAERIYQNSMGTGTTKSWIVYGDGNLYYIPEVLAGVLDMGVLSTLVSGQYAEDNLSTPKAYRIRTYENGWQTFWGIGVIYNSSYFVKP